jgi:hypothetical protein
MFKQLMILFGLIFCIQNLYSQNITGTWEGLMSDEYFKLSVKQQGSQLCGQTFDVVIDNKKNYCKAYCTGQYDKTLQIWYLKGIQFIENSGEHVLMTIKIWKTDNVNSKIMRANITTSDSPLDFFGLETGENLWIRKISNTPQKLAKKLPVCFQKQQTIPEKKIQIKKDIIVQSQNYDLAAKLKDEENVLIEKLRLLNFNDTTTEILFFTPIKKSVIEVKQFQNKLFNKMFLKYLNFNI